MQPLTRGRMRILFPFGRTDILKRESLEFPRPDRTRPDQIRAGQENVIAFGKPEARGQRPEARGQRPEVRARCQRPQARDQRPEARGKRLEARGQRPGTGARKVVQKGRFGSGRRPTRTAPYANHMQTICKPYANHMQTHMQTPFSMGIAKNTPEKEI